MDSSAEGDYVAKSADESEFSEEKPVIGASGEVIEGGDALTQESVGGELGDGSELSTPGKGKKAKTPKVKSSSTGKKRPSK